METEDNKIFGYLVCERTSSYSSQQKPCDEAELMDFIEVDRRATDDPMKHENIGASWYEKGRNHRVENGQIARDFDGKRWMVHIQNSEQLALFIRKYGKVVLSIDDESLESCYKIEIYDGYRE